MTTVETRTESGGGSATGGSARSQLYELQERAWKPRPRVALMIVGASFAVPMISAVIAVQVAARMVLRPAGAVGTVAWLAGMVVLATATMWTVDRLSRRLLPLAAMLRLSLVFPDHAPSRFAATLKTGSGKALERALERATTDTEFATNEHAAALVVGLIEAVLTHDRLTRGHSERVRAYSDLIADEFDLDAAAKNKLHWAALLHDVGKLDVPAAILNKTEKLTNDEWKIIRRHPEASDRWLEPLHPWLGEWARAAGEHHERYDGDGYPNGLRGEEISLAGRIVAVADAFDVMTAARSYKKPYPAAQARVELANNAGSQFDPKVVRAFLAISLGRLRLVMGPLAWLSGLSGMFSVGSITSAATAGVTAVIVAASALAAPAAATSSSHDTRSVAARQAAAAANGSAPGISGGAAGASGASSGHPSHGSAHTSPGATGAGGTTFDTVPVTPIGPSDGTPSSGGSSVSPTPTTTVGGGGTGTSPTPTSSPDTTPGETPTTVPTTIPGVTPTTAPAATAHAPVAHPDHTGTLVNADVTIYVLNNDTDADGNLDPSTLQLVKLPKKGKWPTVSYQSISVVNGTIHLRAGSGFIGALMFTYRVCDTTNLCAQATVTANFNL
jgi:hypothetical protein